jgi:6,7-dimethyl-8-ribityllumazine synthase
MQDLSPATLDARGMRIAIAVSRYHEAITGALCDGALRCWADAGGGADELLVVPAAGTFELTAVCDAIARYHRPEAIVALGCVISGETTHDRHIADAVAGGLTAVTTRTGVPIAFGVLTCQTLEQARARAGGDRGNKGCEAMTAAIHTVATIRTVQAAAGRTT